MLIMTFLKIQPGNYSKAIRVLKNPHVPDGVTVKEHFGGFGDFDAIILIEAEDPSAAVPFILQFGDFCKIKSSVVFDIEHYTWTH